MNIAVIFAGGIGQRMKSKGLPKQFLSVHSKPIIIHTLEHFQFNDRIDAICISCVPEWIDYLKGLAIIIGNDPRQQTQTPSQNQPEKK